MVTALSLAAVLATASALLPPQFGVGVQSSASQENVTERNRQFITTAFDRWEKGEGNFFNDVLAPDVVWTIEGSGPSADVYRGREDLMDRAVRPFNVRLKGPVRPVSKTVWADGDHVIVYWRGQTEAVDGQPYVNDYSWIFRMKDGKASEVVAFLDLAPFDDVLTRIPAPSSN